MPPNHDQIPEPPTVASPVRLEDDPVYNAIYQGIKRGISVTLDNKCFGSALILIYAGMDAMATLSRPQGQEEVAAEDFIGWVNRYIQLDPGNPITGEEWYSARCGVLHNYGVESRRTRNGRARMIGYSYDIENIRPVVYKPQVSGRLVIVSINALSDAFSEGVDRFLIDAFADSQRRPLMEKRLQELLCTYERTRLR